MICFLPKIDPPFQKLKQCVCLCLNVLSIHVYISYVIAIAMIIFLMNLQVIRIPKIYKCMLVALQNGCSFHRKYFIFSLEFMYQSIGIFLNNIFFKLLCTTKFSSGIFIINDL